MSTWVALDASTDRRAHARTVARGREAVLSGGPPPAGLRDVIVGSWDRSRAAGIDAEGGLAPAALAPDEARDRWQRHPVAATVPALRHLLADVEAHSGQVVLFCDVDGTLLWLDGSERLVDEAQAIHLSPGTVWSERAAGTNAMGTALELGHPIQVFSAEHFCRAVHDWTCAAAPVRDPYTGETVGVIDLSGPLSTAHPHTLGLVAAAARLAEAGLRRAPEPPPAPGARLLRRPGAPATPTLRILGRDRVALEGIGELPPRHGELLVLLALRPEGWTAEELAIELLGDFGKPVTVRSEVSRLRARLRGGAIASQPYRLTRRAVLDVEDVEDALAHHDARAALAAYPGPLLPSSEVSAITELRTRLELGVRAAVLAAEDPALLERWLLHPSGRRDPEACRRLAALTAEDDPRRALALGRLRTLAVGDRRSAV